MDDGARRRTSILLIRERLRERQGGSCTLYEGLASCTLYVIFAEIVLPLHNGSDGRVVPCLNLLAKALPRVAGLRLDAPLLCCLETSLPWFVNYSS